MLNNLNIFQENIHLIENIKFFTEENKQFFETILNELKTNDNLKLMI